MDDVILHGALHLERWGACGVRDGISDIRERLRAKRDGNFPSLVRTDAREVSWKTCRGYPALPRGVGVSATS